MQFLLCFSGGSGPRSARVGAIETPTFISGLLFKIEFLFLSIMGAFLVPKASKFAQNYIPKPVPKWILPQTTMLSPRGAPHKKANQKAPKTIPEGRGSTNSLVHQNVVLFLALGQTSTIPHPRTLLGACLVNVSAQFGSIC